MMENPEQSNFVVQTQMLGDFVSDHPKQTAVMGALNHKGGGALGMRQFGLGQHVADVGLALHSKGLETVAMLPRPNRDREPRGGEPSMVDVQTLGGFGT